MNSVVVRKCISDLPATLADALREFLDRASCATPFQDPAFCGEGALGGGTASHHFVIWSGSVVQFYAYCIDNFAFSRALPFLRNTFVQKGPVAADEESFRRGVALLRRWAGSRGCLRLRINPQLPTAELGWLASYAKKEGWNIEQASAAQATLVLDLDAPTATIMLGLHKSTRYEIHRAERVGVVVRKASSQDEIDAFYDVYQGRGRDKRFGTLDSQTFARLMKRVLGDGSRGALFLAHLQGRILGGVVVLRAGRRVHYVYGASNGAPGNAVPVGYPALWAAICWSKDMGAKEFDFGGYGPAGDANVMRFKRGFGGKLVEYVPALSSSAWYRLGHVRSSRSETL